ncbi:MAG TPA: tetratricopeptide repeat protein [Xanthobacteraceae bacterium]|nr:tetratricopeptide repeat protein [Xanthobacteraceae bacterium]
MNRKDRRAQKSDKSRAAGPLGFGVGAAATAQPFAAALRHLQAGQLPDAERLCRQILGADPRHADSLHLLGLIAHLTGRNEAAVDLIGKAIALNDSSPELHNNIAAAWRALGRLDAAAAHSARAVALKPDNAAAHMSLANALRELGKLSEAAAGYRRVLALDPNSAEASNNLGSTLKAQGKLDEAVACYRRALAISPGAAETHYNLGNALVEQRKLDEAQACYQQAVRLKPDYGAAHMNLGNVLRLRGDLEAAAARYRRALELEPASAATHLNLGNVHRDLGQLDAAASQYRRALEFDADYAEAHNNLGGLLLTQGSWDEAVALFQRALALKPELIEAYVNLGKALLAHGRAAEALDVAKRALDLKPTTDAKALFVQCVKGWRGADAGDLEGLLLRALEETWGRPADLVRVGIGLVKRDASIAAGIERATHAGPSRLSAHELLGSAGLTAVADHRLLRGLLQFALVCDADLERFLTKVRAIVLDMAVAATIGQVVAADVLSFCCALARQCFVNEYAYALGEEEAAIVRRLQQMLADAIASAGPIHALWLVALGAYAPLRAVPAVDALLAQSWPNAVEGVFTQQVREPGEERLIVDDIPRLTSIGDEVSLKVRHQYEENPYPRWLRVPAVESVTIDGFLRDAFPLAAFQNLGKGSTIDILIAGCGTGQQSIETAQRFVGAAILAVDLSLASLGHAKRKTQEARLRNVEYAQADILRLGAIERTFDLIEAVGVLHHLAEPLAGWRVLLSLLRPGGVMRLGLYSQLARADIVTARAWITERGYRPTAEDIRRCRQELMSAEAAPLRNVTEIKDFFSTSECRDLLFHVEEHRVTLPEIDAFLREHGLQLLGFDVDAQVLQGYLARFPDDMAATNLDHWHRFETENPRAFIGMYQFWVQKNR